MEYFNTKNIKPGDNFIIIDNCLDLTKSLLLDKEKTDVIGDGNSQVFLEYLEQYNNNYSNSNKLNIIFKMGNKSKSLFKAILKYLVDSNKNIYCLVDSINDINFSLHNYFKYLAWKNIDKTMSISYFETNLRRYYLPPIGSNLVIKYITDKNNIICCRDENILLSQRVFKINFIEDFIKNSTKELTTKKSIDPSSIEDDFIELNDSFDNEDTIGCIII